MNVFIGPGQIILDGPTLDEPVLILMNELLDFGLMPVGQKFGDHLYGNIDEGDWHEVGYPNRIVNFRNQSDIGGVKTFQTQLVVEEVRREGYDQGVKAFHTLN